MPRFRRRSTARGSKHEQAAAKGRSLTPFRRSVPSLVSSRRIEQLMNRFSFHHAPFVIAAVLFSPLVPGGAGSVRAASPFPDKNLEAAIRDVLKHEPKLEFTDEQLQNVYILEASGKQIKDLTGLEKCKNLSQINLAKNKISDLKPLKELENLQSLDLSENAIKDISPLAKLKALQYIQLENNQIDNLDALSGLTNLTSLYLSNNAIKDLSPLAPLVKLWSLLLHKNQIKDISVLLKVTKLATLGLNDNQIDDIGPLAKQTELRILMMERNQIKDLKPLVDAAKADAAGPKQFAPYLRLYLKDNPLSETAKSEQIKALTAAEVHIES
jgi:Leucine-rich repeat (LRR) protein